MHSRNQPSLTRKILSGMMMLSVFLAAFGAGYLPSARAQGNISQTPNCNVSFNILSYLEFEGE
jgi:hypothetical protein